jgi:hypothetical protein
VFHGQKRGADPLAYFFYSNLGGTLIPSVDAYAGSRGAIGTRAGDKPRASLDAPQGK